VFKHDGLSYHQLITEKRTTSREFFKILAALKTQIKADPLAMITGRAAAYNIISRNSAYACVRRGRRRFV